jgi:ornithine carbamoyltransferase
MRTDQGSTTHAIENRDRMLETFACNRRGRPERSVLSIGEMEAAVAEAILEEGLKMKARPNDYRGLLSGISVAGLFQKTSTRTRCSFETGVWELGGSFAYIDWSTTNFVRADLRDEIRVLSRYYDLIVARMNRHEDIAAMKVHSEVPIVNGMCDRYHPCQGLADYMTIKEVFGQVRGVHVAYIGDATNVCHSLIDGAAKFGAHIAVATPDEYRPRTDILGANPAARWTREPEDAVRDADVVYTDSWVSIGQESEAEVRRRVLGRYRIDAALLQRAPAHAVVMHCLPAHRGEEVAGDVLTSKRSVVFEQAENRKHVQKALIAAVMGRD